MLNRLLAMIAICLILTGIVTAEEQSGPWKPPVARPTLPELPRENTEFATRITVALARLEKGEKESAGLPKGGMVVQMLDPNSPAKSLGIKPGDVLLKLDDKLIERGLKAMRSGKPEKLTYWRFGQGEKVIDIPADDFGAWLSKVKDFSATTPGPMASDKRWDADMSIFNRLYIPEPELAQIGLMHAIKAGYPQDALTDRWLAELALNQGHYKQAMDFAWVSLNSSPGKEAAIAFRAAAIASNHVAEASEVVTKYPQFFPNTHGGLQSFAKTKAKHPIGPRALELAKALFKDDILFRAEPFAYFKMNAEVLDSLHKIGKVEWRANTDSTFDVCYIPTAKEFMLSAKIKLSQTRPGPVTSEPRFEFEAPKYIGERPKEFVCALQVTLAPPRVEIVTGGDDLTISMYRAQLFTDPEREHDLMLAVCDGKTEVMLDGESIYYCDSAAPNAMFGFSLMNVGMHTKFRDVQTFELVTEERYKEIAKTGATEKFRLGQSRLHRAAAFNLTREAEVLINSGADVNLADQDGSTPLHLAASHGSKEVLQLLLSKGAKSDVQDKKSKTPAMLAHDNGFEDLAKILGGNQPAKPRPNNL